MPNNKTGIIIINRNDYKNTSECLNSLIKNNNKELFNIIIIDNNSQDGSLELLSKEFNLKKILPSNNLCNEFDINKPDPNFNIEKKSNIIISLSDNFGFTGANNFGFKYCLQNNYNYSLILNNDTITNPHLIEDLINTEKKFKNHIISCTIMCYPKKNLIWNLGSKLNILGMPTNTHIGKKETIITKMPEFIFPQLGSGCCLFIKSSILEKIGGQDHNYFFNVDDTDFTYKATKNNIKLVVKTTTKIYHKAGVSVSDKPNLSLYYFYRNLLYFRKKYFSFSQNIIPILFISYKLIKSFTINCLTRKRDIRIYLFLLKDIFNKKLGKYDYNIKN